MKFIESFLLLERPISAVKFPVVVTAKRPGYSLVELNE